MIGIIKPGKKFRNASHKPKATPVTSAALKATPIF